MEDLVRKYGFYSKLASVRIVPGYPLDFSVPTDALQQSVRAEAQKAVDHDGADTIIGYGSIEMIEFLQMNLKVPAISPIQASVMMAESLVRLKLRQSEVAFPSPVDLAKTPRYTGDCL